MPDAKVAEEAAPRTSCATSKVVEIYLGEEFELREISALVGGYGRITILRGVDLKVARGELVALVGVNGAGETTLMKSIAGLLQTAGGRISFDGVDITGKGTERTVEAGMVLVPEGRMVFPRMTVWENLMLGGMHARPRPNRDASMERVFNLFPGLPSGAIRRPRQCPAVNSRCWRSGAV